MIDYLIIGASGQIGWHLYRALENQNRSVKGSFRDHPIPDVDFIYLDISDRTQCQQIIHKLQPRHILLPASSTNVDYCENHPEETYNTNVTGIENVIDAARLLRSQIVFFSTDYIFDGVSGPYDENSLPNPVCEYGKQKIAAEHLILSNISNAMVVRTTVVYSWEPQGKNFLVRLLKALRDGIEIQAPMDQIGTPTYAPSLATAVIQLIDLGHRGIYHLAGMERTTRYEFAREAAAVFGLDERLIHPVETKTLSQPARRPLNAGLISYKLDIRLREHLIGYRDGLRRMRLEYDRWSCPEKTNVGSDIR